jgi:hypothetical protein
LILLGVPVFFFAMLYRYRKRLTQPGIQLQLGFLYAGQSVALSAFPYLWLMFRRGLSRCFCAAYDPSLWFFELFDMANKLM